MSSTELLIDRQSLLDQIASLTVEEAQIHRELQSHLSLLMGKSASASVSEEATREDYTQPSPSSASSSSSSSSIVQKLRQIESFAPVFETVRQNTDRLSAQVEDCSQLSERLNSLVRQLDLKQMRAQRALACTEDILNLKECKHRLLSAIEERDLSAAVKHLRQVHEIDETAARTSEDFEVILEKEKEVKELVRVEFQRAISQSEIDTVMSLCPLLHTLGLETEARDRFLAFMEEKVFVGVSADLATPANEDNSFTDASTGYAQALSSIFNATYLIIQQYLPMVITGLEHSLGDVHFLRKLHKRCEQEAGTVLKRYMKYRAVKDMIASMKSSQNTASNSNSNNNSDGVNNAEVHIIMDELALLVQYCCKYSKYLRHVCAGAEQKTRHHSNGSEEKEKDSEGLAGKNSTPPAVIVFPGVLEFDRMVDELVSKYYLEGEQWLMRQGVAHTLPRDITRESTRLDECFFVLQKCGLRAVASNNIQAACAVMMSICDFISNDLHKQAQSMLECSLQRVLAVWQEHLLRYRKSLLGTEDGSGTDNSRGSSGGNALAVGFTNAFSLASTLAGTVGATAGHTSDGAAASTGVIFHENGGFTLAGTGSAEDPWGTMGALEALNTVELCTRYTDRLSKDLIFAAQSVFDSGEDSSSSHSKANDTHAKNKKDAKGNKTGKGSLLSAVAASVSDGDRLRVCQDNFESSKTQFSTALRQTNEKIIASVQSSIKDLLLFTLGRNAVYGGVRFQERDELFDQQEILVLLPKIVAIPLETMVSLLCAGLSERNKEVLVSALADVCCEKFEQFIHQNMFSFAGALKMEEIVRAVSSLFSRHSSGSVRGKFSRLREIMMVLTAESSASVAGEHFTILTASEAESFLALRVDCK